MRFCPANKHVFSTIASVLNPTLILKGNSKVTKGIYFGCFIYICLLRLILYEKNDQVNLFKMKTVISFLFFMKGISGSIFFTC